MNLDREIAEIGDILRKARLLLAVRKATESVLKRGFVVSTGSDAEGMRQDIVISCGRCDEVARRIRDNVPNVDVERISENMLGVRTARRVRGNMSRVES